MQQLAAGLAIHCWICCHDQEQEDPMSIIQQNTWSSNHEVRAGKTKEYS